MGWAGALEAAGLCPCPAWGGEKTLTQDVAVQEVPAPPGWGQGRVTDVLSSSHVPTSPGSSLSPGDGSLPGSPNPL